MTQQTIAILGGTGKLGSGLACRLFLAGYSIIIGSRTPNSAQEAANAIASRDGSSRRALLGDSNINAARAADIVIVTVPYASHAAILRSIAEVVRDKVVVDATVPLRPPSVGRVQLPAAGAAGVEAQRLLPQSRVVSAFQNVAATHISGDEPIDCDVLVCGNDSAARDVVIDLVRACGMRGLHAGPIENAAAAEALTSVLITINRAFRCHAGIRLTGLPVNDQ